MTYYRCHNPKIKCASQKGRIALSLSIIFVLVILIVLYLIQMNTLVAKNFELHSFQKTLTQGQEKDQSLLVSLMQMRSLNNLQQAAKNLNLVIIEKANYLKVGLDSFAFSE